MTYADRQAAYFTRCRDTIAQHGWMLQGVFPVLGDEGPGFTYTVGLSAVPGRPELIMFGLDSTAPHVLNDLAGRIVAGERFAHGDVRDDLFGEGYLATLITVADTTGHLTLANRFHGPGGPGGVVNAIQVVWPDTSRHWPWDPAYDHTEFPQPVIGATP